MIPLNDNVRLSRTPVVTIALVVANVIAYVLAAVHGGSLVGGPSGQTVVRYGAIPYELSHWGQHCALGVSLFHQALLCTGQHGVIGTTGAQPATSETAVTAMFLHANILALALNMVFLAAFGATVEDRVGRLAFLALYVVGGLVALALQVAVAAGSAAPMLGASGALATALGAYAVLHPRAKVRTLVMAVVRVGFVELTAWVVITAWFAFDAILGAIGLGTRFGGGAGVAYFAHWGGFALGAIAALALLKHQPGGAGNDQISPCAATVQVCNPAGGSPTTVQGRPPGPT